MNKEIWKECENHTGWMISNYGNLKNPNGDLATIYKHHGYLYSAINKKYYRIHRLVAFAFIPNSDNKPHVNHIDSVRDNNNVVNLEWCTPTENMRHAASKGKMNGSRNIKVINNSTGEIYTSMMQASITLKKSVNTIWAHVHNKNKKQNKDLLHISKAS